MIKNKVLVTIENYKDKVLYYIICTRGNTWLNDLYWSDTYIYSDASIAQIQIILCWGTRECAKELDRLMVRDLFILTMNQLIKLSERQGSDCTKYITMALIICNSAVMTTWHSKH